MDGAFVEEAGEQKSEQIDRDRCNSGFGGQVLAVQVINTADARIGNNQLIGKLGDRRVHGGIIGQQAGKGK